jgi:uncharacterized Fe-S center protein
MRIRNNRSLLDKLEILIRKAGIEQIDFKDKFTAIKIHFGEPGNMAYIRPNYAARVAKFLLGKGAKPFLTDACTLYTGRRSNGLDHLASAYENGFNPIAIPCPVIIADGLRAIDYVEVPLNMQYCQSAKIGAAIAEADIVISMNHFKGHEQAGFGGALKNLGMGAAARAGKLELHSSSKPVIDAEKCTSCGQCIKNCASDAIFLNEKKKAVINYELCVGCGQCVASCNFDSAQPVWDNSTEIMNYRVAEYTYAVLNGKPNFHINFIIDVSPDCDCWNCNDAAIVPNIGIAASFDPVALDQLCADLVTKAPALGNNKITDRHQHHDFEGKEKFRLVHPNTKWEAGLDHAEEIGLGTRQYELINIDK